MAAADFFGNDWTDTQDGLDTAIGGNLFFNPQYGALALTAALLGRGTTPARFRFVSGWGNRSPSTLTTRFRIRPMMLLACRPAAVTDRCLSKTRSTSGSRMPIPTLTFGISSTSMRSGKCRLVVVRSSLVMRAKRSTRFSVAGNWRGSTAGTQVFPKAPRLTMLAGRRTGMRRATRSESNRFSPVRIVAARLHPSSLAVIRTAFTRASGMLGPVNLATGTCSGIPAMLRSIWA